MALIPEEEQLVAATTVSMNLLELIGNGIDFPLTFSISKKVGSVKESNAGERINDSIHLILETRIGERVFNPEFGSRLPELVFEPNDPILHRLLHLYTVEALNRWEKRIEIVQVTLSDNQEDYNEIGISISYRIRNSHIQGSFVYPFVLGGMPTSSLYTGIESRRLMEHGALE